MNDDQQHPTQRPSESWSIEGVRLSPHQSAAILSAAAAPGRLLRKAGRSAETMSLEPYAHDQKVLRALEQKGLIIETKPERIEPVKEGEWARPPYDFERRWELTPYGERRLQVLQHLAVTPPSPLTPARKAALAASADDRGIVPSGTTSAPEQGIFYATTVLYLIRAGFIERGEDERYYITDAGKEALR